MNSLIRHLSNLLWFLNSNLQLLPACMIKEFKTAWGLTVLKKAGCPSDYEYPLRKRPEPPQGQRLLTEPPCSIRREKDLSDSSFVSLGSSYTLYRVTNEERFRILLRQINTPRVSKYGGVLHVKCFFDRDVRTYTFFGTDVEHTITKELFDTMLYTTQTTPFREI